MARLRRRGAVSKKKSKKEASVTSFLTRVGQSVILGLIAGSVYKYGRRPPVMADFGQQFDGSYDADRVSVVSEYAHSPVLKIVGRS
jgi:hypothetical protein